MWQSLNMKSGNLTTESDFLITSVIHVPHTACLTTNQEGKLRKIMKGETFLEKRTVFIS